MCPIHAFQFMVSGWIEVVDMEAATWREQVVSGTVFFVSEAADYTLVAITFQYRLPNFLESRSMSSIECVFFVAVVLGYLIRVGECSRTVNAGGRIV